MNLSVAKPRVTRTAKTFIGLTPWLCDYQFLGLHNTIVLFAESEEQLEEDFSEFSLTVVGEFVCSGDTDPDDD